MKILHTSDLHLASPLNAHLSGEGARMRKRELSELPARLLEAARREGCSAMIIAGDLFDSECVSRPALEECLDAIRHAREISVFYLAGNHEGEIIRESGLELPKNLFIFGEDWTSFVAGDVVITGRSSLTADAFDTLRLDPKMKNIVVLHGELREHTEKDVIGRRDATGRGIDYLALGHYHSYDEHKLDGRTRAVYSGTPEGRGFDEVGDKGYVIIDTDERVIAPRFVPFAKRTIHWIKLDITGVGTQGELYELIDKRLAAVDSSSLVRLELVGEYKEGLWKNAQSVERRFAGGFFYFEVRDSSRMALDLDKLRYDKTLKGEFIRLVMADDTIPPDRKEKIISCGLYSLLGEAAYEV